MQNFQLRDKIHPKQKVMVLLKEDYETGELTEGIVQEVLTTTESHYRGIKVKIMPENETEKEKEIRKKEPDYRLVGRVKMIMPVQK